MWILLAAFTALASLASAATLQGTIIEDHTGMAVPSASVRMTTGSLQGLAADLETDGQGRFEAAGLPEGEYRVDVTRSGFLNATLRLHITSAPVNTRIRLIRCAVVSGSVVDGAGRPVPGATVFAMTKPAGGKPWQRDFDRGHFANVDAKGDFRLFGLPPGQYLIAASYGASSTAYGPNGGATPPSNPGSGVIFYPDNSKPQIFDLGPGENRGNVVFSVIPAALYSIKGTVTLPDPKTAFWVALTPVEHPEIAVAVASFDKGSEFVLQGIPPGSYNLTAFGPVRGFAARGAVFAFNEPQQPPMFARVPLTVGGQNIEGIALTPEKGKPIHFVLRLTNGAGAFCPATAQLALTQIEDLGTMTDQSLALKAEEPATVPFLVPEHYSMSLTGLGDNCVLTGESMFDAAQAPDPVVLTVGPAGNIRGKLSAPAGSPPSMFQVVLAPAELNAAEPVLATIPDDQFQFAFTGLKPGRYRIAAQTAAGAVHWLANDQAVEVEVHPGSAVQIELAAEAAVEK
jgi:hypothetical protein